jgi:acyl dehydratase
MFSPQYFEDMEIGGKRVTKGRTITETDLVNFSGLTWDTFSLHNDAEYAKNTIFGERIAHGMMIMSYAIGLLSVEPSSTVAFYGFDKLRFTGPTKIGDTIHVETELTDKEDKGAKGGVVTTHLLVRNQRGETVIDAVTKTLVAHKPENK